MGASLHDHKKTAYICRLLLICLTLFFSIERSVFQKTPVDYKKISADFLLPLNVLSCCCDE